MALGISIARAAGSAAVSRERNPADRSRVELDALWGSLTTLAEFQAMIARFVTMIANQGFSHVVSPQTIEYLVTEGNLFAEDQEGDGTLSYVHLLYWVNRKLIENKVSNGGALDYDDRLSEMTGWGDENPTTLANGDPLGLVDTLESLGVAVCVVDANAADDTTADSEDGAVLLTFSSNNCTTIGGTPKTYNNGGGASAALMTSSSTYRYRYLKNIEALNCTGGSSTRRFPSDGNKAVWLVRYADTHALSKECLVRKASGDTDSTRIDIVGYPGELPVINMGSSLSNSGALTTPDDVTYNRVGQVTGSERINMIRMGNAAGTEQLNTHLRNLEIHGRRRLSDDSGWSYACTLILYSSVSSGSIRHCVFRHTQFIRPDDADAGTYPDLVDDGWASRSSTIDFSNGVRTDSDEFVFDSNYVEPVAALSWSKKPDNYATFAYVWLEIKADNVRMTRNTFRGVKTNSMMRAGDATTTTDGFYCADNDMESYDKACIDLFNSTNFIIERNRCSRFGQDDYCQESGSGIKVSYCRDGIIRHNVVYNYETAEVGTLGIVLQTLSGEQTTERIDVYENIVYRCGVRLDVNGNAVNLTNCDVRRNLIAGMNEARKGTTHTNAPIHLELFLEDGTTEGNRITDNVVWRFTNTAPTSLDSETGYHLSIRAGGSQNQYYTSQTADGWSGGTSRKPAWAGDPESGDFRLSVDPIGFPPDMPFTAALSKAWSPGAA